MGGDLTYQLKDSATGLYNVSFNAYKDCFCGTVWPSNLNLNIVFSNGNAPMNIVFPLKNPPGITTLNPMEVTPLCSPKPITTCNGNNAIKGTLVYRYNVLVIIPKNYGMATMSVESAARNVNTGIGSIKTISSANIGFRIEAKLNTNLTRGNNSPSFQNTPVPYICRGSLHTYNHFALDKDGDSIAYMLYTPWSTSSITVDWLSPTYSLYKPIDMPPGEEIKFIGIYA
jgi:hypothetical protein